MVAWKKRKAEEKSNVVEPSANPVNRKKLERSEDELPDTSFHCAIIQSGNTCDTENQKQNTLQKISRRFRLNQKVNYVSQTMRDILCGAVVTLYFDYV